SRHRRRALRSRCLSTLMANELLLASHEVEARYRDAASSSDETGKKSGRGLAPPYPRMEGPVFSVDVEDYFHVEAFSDIVPRERWGSYTLRVEDNTRRILDLLDEHQAKATFFVLGWVADRRPQLVRDIAGRGHEVGCHSYWHRLVYSLTPREFAEDTAHAKHV